MSQSHPELIFVSGPQAGQRVVLAQPEAVIGRSGDADIVINEEFVSRRQARYIVSRDGPILENLSDRGTWINGKRFKAGKQVLLDTGDLIGVGRDTEMLFVAAGDEAEAAQEKFRQSSATGKDAFGRKRPLPAEPAPVEEPPSPSPAEEASQEKSPSIVKEKQAELSPAERLALQGRIRRKKLVVGLGVYLGLVLLAGIFLYLYSGSSQAGHPMPPMLSEEEIGQNLSKPAGDVTPNPIKMNERLKYARGLYQQYGLSSAKLYECATAFKEALAYSGQTSFTDPQVYMIYQKVMDSLTEVVRGKYRDACLHEKNHDWRLAEREFKELLLIVGDQDNPVFKNVQKHYARSKYFREKKETKRRGAAF